MPRAFQIGSVVWRYAIVPKLFRRRAVPGPVRLRRALEELGGTWIKLGQTLALRFDLLPAEYCLELFKLLNEVRPFPYEQVRATVVADLGADPETVFRSFEHEPFASASIGQVHRAVTQSGETVAVKVQRPNVGSLIAKDMRLMYLGAAVVDRTRVFGATRARDVIDEFARWTSEELDYRIEARHAANLRENARGDRLEHDARVYFELSSERVLTMEMIEGVPLIEIMYALRDDNEDYVRDLESRGHDLERIARHLTWNSLNQIYRQGYFHADLHPANLFVLERDEIAYVDFGIVGTLSAQVRESLVHYAWNLFQGNVDRAAEEFMRWVRPSASTDVQAARHEIIQLLEEYLFSFRDLDANRPMPGGVDFEVNLLSAIRAYDMSVSPAIVPYFKALVTANAVLFELSPTFDLEAIENRFFGSMILRDTRELADFRTLSGVLFDYSYRAVRALETVETAREAEQRLESVALAVRRRLELLAPLALGVGLLLFIPTTRSFAREQGWLYWALIAVFVVLLLAIFHQSRRLVARPARVRGAASSVRARYEGTGRGRALRG